MPGNAPLPGGRIGGTCAVCGRAGHRYGTTDPEHEFNATACVNGLLHEIEQLRSLLVVAWEGDKL